jgi:hypothetical protein
VRQGYHSKENNITQKLEKKKFSCPNGKWCFLPMFLKSIRRTIQFTQLVCTSKIRWWEFIIPALKFSKVQIKV